MKKGLAVLLTAAIIIGPIFLVHDIKAMPLAPTPAGTSPAAPAPAPSLPIAPPTPAATPATTSIPAAQEPTPAAPAVTVPATSTTPTPVTSPAPEQPATSSTTPTQPEEEKKEIYLNFENTELASFVEYIAELKKLNVIPDKSMEGSKISLTIREPLSVEGAWNVFLTVLEMAGFSIVEAGGLHRVVPKDKKIMQPLPAYVNVPYEQLPDNDLTIRYVLFLTNIQAETIQPLLESMLSTPNSIHAQKDMNAFIITDKSYNVKAAAKLLTELDQMGLPETVTVLRLQQANATDVKQLLEALIKKPEGNPLARLLGKAAEGGTNYFSESTRIVAEERTNSLILMGTTKSIDKIVDFITKHLDTQIKEAESPLHIYELQHVDAKQVVEILKEVTQMPDSATGQAAGKFGSIRGGVKYFRGMNFQVDKDGNRLIVSCIDKQDWTLLKKTLQDLDKPQPQVAIESLIVTVNASDVKALGGIVRNKKHGQIGKNIDFQSAPLTGSPSLEGAATEQSTATSLLGNLINQIVPAKGQTILTFGKGENIWSVFKVLKQQNNASLLSQPFITVANKTSALIEVGEVRRVVSEEQGENRGFADAEASTALKITPQINLDGVIRLKIELDIVDFIDPGSADNKTKKHLDSNITVADGQVLVLGGFVKTKVDEVKVKTPILGDIPVLGWLFKNQQRTITKEYVFIFMSPTIIKPRQSPGMQLYTKMKLHQATEDIEEAIETKRTQDPIHNWFFNPEKENYSHKVIDFANARYQPTTVDIKNDPYYRAYVEKEEGAPPAKPVVPAELGPAEPVTIMSAADIKAEVETPAEPITPPPLPATPVDAIAQQRARLKSLISNALPTPVQASMDDVSHGDMQGSAPTPMSTTDTVTKRNTLKEFLATPEQEHTSKRNKLKEFLSANRSLQSHKDNLGERKA